jgi:outer membrane protein TolC
MKRRRHKMKKSIISIICLLLTISLNLTAEELGIDEIISIAIENSEAIKAEDTKSGKDEYEKKAVFMRFFPTISLEAKLLKLEYFPEPDKLTVDLSETVQQLGEAINASSPIPINLPTELPPKEIDLGVPTHQRTLDLTVVQPLTPLWGIYHGYKALELKSEITKLKSELTKDKIKLEIVKIYNSYNMLSDILKLLDESFEQLDRYEKNAEKFHKAGLIDETALYKIKVERAALEVEKEKYLGNQSVIKAALAMFMNRDEESFEVKYDKPEFREITKSEDEIIEAQASNRTEMHMLDKNTEIQEHLNKRAIQNFIPQVGLTFGFKKNWDSTLINPEGVMFFGAVARWEFGFDTARQYYEYQAVKASSVSTELTNIKLKKDMTLQVKKLMADIKVLEKALEQNKTQIESAEVTRKIQEAKYEKQMTTETELLNAQLMVKKSKTEEIANLYKYKIALDELAIITGSEL